MAYSCQCLTLWILPRHAVSGPTKSDNFYPVQEISCPTLVVHGRHDGNVPFSHAQFVADGVPDAQLFVAETCGHLIWMSDDAQPVRDKVTSFLLTTLSDGV